MREAKVAVVILTHDAPAYVQETIETLRRVTAKGFACEVIVLDNASGPTTRDLLNQMKVRGLIDKLVFSERNLLYASGNNYASTFCSADCSHILLLNSDVRIVSPAWLKKLLAAKEAGGFCAASFGLSSDPPKADGYCFLIDRDLFLRHKLDERYEWWFALSRLQANLLRESRRILVFDHHERFIHHHGGKSGSDWKGARGMDTDIQEVRSWFADVEGKVIVRDAGRPGSKALRSLRSLGRKLRRIVRRGSRWPLMWLLMGPLGKALIYFRPPRPKRGMSALLLPGDDPGSVGDDAMLQAVLQHLRGRGVTGFGVVKFSPERKDLSNYGPDVREEPGWKGIGGLREALQRYHLFYVFGADIMDGHYSAAKTCAHIFYAHAARLLGRRSFVLGFSFNRNPAKRVLDFFRRVHPGVKLFVRDPQSLSRFQAAAGRSAKLVADTAFLLKPSGPTSRTLGPVSWVDRRRANGGLVIGVNLNPLLLRGFDAGERERFLASFRSLLETLARDGDHLLLAPHDYRRAVGDLDLMKALFDDLPADVRANARLVDERLSAAESKELCGSLDAVISGRMHLCVAALGRAVPAFGLSYQDKFRGLMELFFDNYVPVVDVAECGDSATLRDAVRDFLARRDDLRAQIQSRLPAVMAMAMEGVPK